MPIDSGNLALKGLDDLFSTEENRQEEQREQVQQIPIDALHPFINHPFKVLDDEAMTRTVESIAQYGVLAPLIARPRPDGDGYEIISGHRRQYAAKLAGLDTLPVIVRNMDDNAAVLLMVDSNLQREHILPSERAFAYKMKLEALKNQGARSDLTSGQIGPKLRSDEQVALDAGESRKQVQRFIRLTNLIPELLDMVDEKKIAFNPAVELSYLDESQQRDFLEAMEGTQNAPSVSQAQQLKKMAQCGEFTYEKAFDILGQEKKSEQDTVTIKNDILRKYFPRNYTPRQMEEKIIQLLLCVTSDGRKIGLDVRLMNPMLPDDPNSKLNVCVQNVLKIWEEGKDQKLTQLLFCDLSTPKNDGNFNVYEDIRKKLIAAGVPENEIEFIHNADTEAKKAALFSKVRSGDVRVLLGSTAKMGAGTNVQSRLVAVHHLDVGWKPSDMTQRNGRIIRQGNMNKEVKVFNYVTEGTFDSYLYQTLENKQRFISQIMTSKSPVRSCEDVDEQALSYAEIKALCAGNPLIKEKMDLDVQVAKLKVLKADHQSQKFRLQDKLLTKFPADIQEATAHIAGLKADAQLAAAHPQGKEEFCGMVIKGVTYDEKKTAGERLVLACSELPNAEEKVIGSYRGFELSLRFDTFRSEYLALLKGQRKYTVPLGTDPLGNIIRLDNSLNNFPERITAAENELATLHQQQAAAQIEVEKPFPQEEELAEKSARLAELNAQLDVDEKSHDPEQDEEEQEDAPRRPSVLAALEEKSDKPEPVKPFRSYYDKDGDAR